MIQALFESTGIWFWWIIGILLIGIEIMAPGTFFLWFGLAAFAVGLVTMVLGAESAIWGWQAQIMAFAVLALLFAVAGRHIMARRGPDEGELAGLNERGRQLIGRQGVITQAVAGGAGRVRIGDTTWRVTGPDLAEGAMVVIVDAKAETLIVEPAENRSEAGA